MLSPWQKTLAFTKSTLIVLFGLSILSGFLNWILWAWATVQVQTPDGLVNRQVRVYPFGQSWFLTILLLIVAGIVLLMYDSFVQDEEKKLRKLKTRWEQERMSEQRRSIADELAMRGYRPDGQPLERYVAGH